MSVRIFGAGALFGMVWRTNGLAVSKRKALAASKPELILKYVLTHEKMVPERAQGVTACTLP